MSAEDSDKPTADLDIHVNPDRRFFGRKKGKTISSVGYGILDRYQDIIFRDDPLPLLQKAQNALQQGEYQAAVLEIGFGGGDFLLDQADHHPEILFLGCELFINGVLRLTQRIDEKPRPNIFIFNGDALALLKADHSLRFEKIYLLFPDPWPKKRHRKRRFLQNDTAKLLYERLTPGGDFHFATDIPEYAEWGLIKMNQIPELQLTDHPIDRPFSERIITKYQSKSLLKEHDRYFFRYHKKPTE